MTNDNELMHYGVIGMKWGVHRGNVSSAYSKATAKRKKLDDRVVKAKKAYDKATIKANTGASLKYQKLQSKADKMQSKADSKKYGLFTSAEKAAKLQIKADRMQYKANKYKNKYGEMQAAKGVAKAKYVKAQQKAEKWVRSMDKTFSKQHLSEIEKKYSDKGADYLSKRNLLDKSDQKKRDAYARKSRDMYDRARDAKLSNLNINK